MLSSFPSLCDCHYVIYLHCLHTLQDYLVHCRALLLSAVYGPIAIVFSLTISRTELIALVLHGGLHAPSRMLWPSVLPAISTSGSTVSHTGSICAIPVDKMVFYDHVDNPEGEASYHCLLRTSIRLLLAGFVVVSSPSCSFYFFVVYTFITDFIKNPSSTFISSLVTLQAPHFPSHKMSMCSTVVNLFHSKPSLYCCCQPRLLQHLFVLPPRQQKCTFDQYPDPGTLCNAFV